MNDPILESLSFCLDSDLQVENVRSSEARSSSERRLEWEPHHNQPPKNSKSMLPSAVILGEDCKTPCLTPGCPFIMESISKKENKDLYLAHLLSEHKLVIDDVDQIASLHKYIVFWKEKFTTCQMKEFCVGFFMAELPDASQSTIKSTDHVQNPKDQEDTKISEKVTKPDKPIYYMLTPAVSEDKELREKIWNRRLESVLEVNRQEREQKDFSRQCLLCREVFSGNRTLLFEHMKKDHSFHIGKPDNIVFVEQFLELIADKLNKLICLQCEKIFKDKTVLRDHMRKKGHKRLNSNNPEYDRYYIVNYLEPGKDWKSLEQEDQEDERVEEDWMEANEEKGSVVCLFCSYQSSNFDEILGHMIKEHKFDFVNITFVCDFYQKVKIVNFIRRTVFLNTCLFCERKFLERTMLVKHIAEHEMTCNERFPSDKIWNQPEYYFPTYENDQFLVLLDQDNHTEDEVCSIVSSEDELLVIPEDPPKMTLSKTSLLDMDLN